MYWQMTTDDMELVREYARQDSGEAFAALVSRHVNLVYSVALRQTGDAHLAEEITQAVFIVLARKAKSLGDKTILSGWLCRTARNVSANALTIQRRRQRREQEAYMQSLLNEPTADERWRQIAPLLDAALARLGGKDHDAIVLRFFENKELKQVGAALGVSEDAAKKRVSRALEKLRRFFFKRGVDSKAATIGETISANSIQAAPVALAKSATVVALTKGAAASISTATLAKATLVAMKTKILIATAAATAVVILGTGTFFLAQSKISPAPITGETIPIKFTNDTFTAVNDPRFVVDVDPNVKRTPDSEPAGHVKSLVEPTGADDYLASLGGTNRPLSGSRYVTYHVAKGSALLGKRVRIGGWMKTSDVKSWAGATLLIQNQAGYIFADDDMTDRPIRGTTDWQQVDFVADVPNEPCIIIFVPTLYGTGEVWFDDFQVNIVPSDTPVTDDRPWHLWSPNSYDYSVTTDYNVTHDGHPTFCIAYTPAGNAPKGSWMWWGQDIRGPKKYAGHMVRMTVWTKTELGASSTLRPNLRPKTANFKLVAQDRMLGGGRISGTSDWTLRTIVCMIPKDTQCLDTGFAFHGSGKVWIDMKSLKYEIIDNPNKPKLIQ